MVAARCRVSGLGAQCGQLAVVELRSHGHGHQPSTDSFTIGVIEATSRVELRWHSGPVVEVPDYDGYPYLRVGPDGVVENQQSFAVYLNRDRNGATTVPENLKPEGAPQWKRISSEPVARWHDHRVHWMGTVRPDRVVQRPAERQVVQPFTVDVRQGSATFRVSGTLEWVPGPSPLPYLLRAAASGLALLALALWVGLRPDRRDAARIVVAVSCVALVMADAVHLVGIAFGIRGTTSQALARMVSVGFVSMLAWIVLLVASVLLLRRRFDAFYLVVLGAGLVALIGGLADVGVLSRTSAPFAFPVWTLRILVTLTIGLGAGLGVAAVLLTRRAPEPVATDIADQPEGAP